MPRNPRHDPRADAYIEGLPDWQQAICRQVRDLALGTDPEMVETVKRTVQPYYVLQGNVAALLAAKDWVNVFVYSADLDDPAGLVTGGAGNVSGRTIAIHRDQPVDGDALAAVFRQVVAQNRAGRKAVPPANPRRPVDVPDALRDALDGAGLADAFAAQPYYRRKDWVDSVTSAKRPQTRERRLAAVLDALR